MTLATSLKDVRFVRYPGGKQRLLVYLMKHLPQSQAIEGRYIEPFVGGGSVFFAIKPRQAILSDINLELITLYRGLRRSPTKVWEIFQSYPASKQDYYEIRNLCHTILKEKNLAERAARTLYLNRTCFKGMWRHNSSGQFNVGYGGQDRRWVVSHRSLLEISRRLKNVTLKCNDFGKIIDQSIDGDFIFLDPPYRPNQKELLNDHYVASRFSFQDHQRLAEALGSATQRGVRWAMTTSSHKDIVALFENYTVLQIAQGTGEQPGKMVKNPGEVLIFNYD